jgi:transcriptional regulator with XRE-family HTH domain
MASNNIVRLDQLPGFTAAESDAPPRVYFSGPLTWYADRDPIKHAEVLELAEAVERALAGCGFEVHIPHRDGGHDNARETYLLNRSHIARASLVVAYYDYPSTGLGQELEVAAAHMRPVVLLVNERRGNVSTMIRSALFTHQLVVFDDHETLAEELPPIAEALARPPKECTLAERLGTAVQRERMARGMTQEALATLAGCSLALVRYVENHEPGIVSPSLVQLEQLAGALETDAAALLGLVTRAQSLERRVIEFAARSGRSSATALKVLDAAARSGGERIEGEEKLARLFDIVEGPAGAEGRTQPDRASA